MDYALFLPTWFWHSSSIITFYTKFNPSACQEACRMVSLHMISRQHNEASAIKVSVLWPSQIFSFSNNWNFVKFLEQIFSFVSISRINYPKSDRLRKIHSESHWAPFHDPGHPTGITRKMALSCNKNIKKAKQDYTKHILVCYPHIHIHMKRP